MGIIHWYTNNNYDWEWDTEEENSASPGSNKSKNEQGREAQGNVCFRFTKVLFEKNWQWEYKDKADDEIGKEELEEVEDE